jgi:hypothetical protein
MRRFLIRLLAPQINDLIDEAIMYWIESGKLTMVMAAQSEHLRTALRRALDDILIEEHAATMSAAVATGVDPLIESDLPIQPS